jgi:threonine 3-dehydrogenase
MLAMSKVQAVEGGVGLTAFEMKEPKAGEVRLKVQAAGVCGTDMQIYKWAPRMARRMALPRVMGHEVSGIVDAVGPGVTRLTLGQQAVLESHIFCGHCHPCQTDKAHLCENTRYPGIDIDGGFAPYIVVPEQIVYPLDQPLEPQIAAMLEPFGIGVHAALEGTGVAGQSVLVNGCGPIGLMAIAAARALGARRILAADANPRRLKIAEQLGADRIVDVRDESIVHVARDGTGGRGVDVGMEFSGTEAGFNAVFESLAKGADFRLIGGPSGPIPVDFTYWLLKCPTLYNIHGRRIWKTWAQAMPLIYEGRVCLHPLVSHVLPIAESPRAFELILQGEAVKPIVVPA